MQTVEIKKEHCGCGSVIPFVVLVKGAALGAESLARLEGFIMNPEAKIAVIEVPEGATIEVRPLGEIEGISVKD